MKTLKLLGIAALSALLVFGVIACGDPETKELEGADLRVFTYYGTDNNAYATKQITATWNGDEDVTYEWFLGETSISTTNVCTPSAVSAATTLKLVVTAEDAGYDPLERIITVLPAPAHVDYLGVWTMDYTKSENNAWKTDTANGGEFSEYVTITETEYYLRSEKQTAGKDEFFKFTITGWAPATTASTTDSTYAANTGFTLTGTLKEEHGGYTITGGSFAIYVKAGNPPTQVSDRRTTNNAAIKRYYERKEIDNIVGL